MIGSPIDLTLRSQKSIATVSHSVIVFVKRSATETGKAFHSLSATVCGSYLLKMFAS